MNTWARSHGSHAIPDSGRITSATTHGEAAAAPR